MLNLNLKIKRFNQYKNPFFTLTFNFLGFMVSKVDLAKKKMVL